MRFFRFLFALILFFGLLFALLQTRWVQDKVIEQFKDIHLEVGSVEGIFPFSLQIDRLSCSLFNAPITGEKVKVRLSPFALLKGTLAIHLKADRVLYESGLYSLDLQADLRRRGFLFDLRLSPYAHPQEVLQIDATGSKKRNYICVQVEANLPSIEEIKGHCSLHGSWASWDAFLHQRNMLSPITLTCQGQLRPSGGSPLLNRLWSIDVQSAFDNYHTYSVSRMQLQSDLFTLQGQGTIGKQLETSRFDAQFTFLDLSLLNDKLHGSLGGKVQLAHSQASLDVKDVHIDAHPLLEGWEGTLTSTSGRLTFYLVPFSSLSLSDLSFSTGPFFASGAMELDLTRRQIAGDLYARWQDVGSGTLRFSQDQGNQAFDVFFLGEGITKKEAFELTMQGRYTLEKGGIELETTRLTGNYLSYPFALNAPFVLEKSGNHASLSHLDMSIGSGTLTASCDLSPVRSTGSFDLHHFPLEWLRQGVSGSLTANGFFDAMPDNLQGALNAILEEAHFIHLDREPFNVKGTLQAHVDRSILQTHLHLMASQEQSCEASATLPLTYCLYPFKLAVDQTGSLSAECVTQARLEELLDFANFGSHQLTGFLTSRFLLAGSVEAPIVQGKLFWEEGSYDNYLTGTALKDIHAELSAEKDQIHLTAFSASDGKKGRVSAEGSLDLDAQRAFPYRLTVELEGLHALHFNPLDCTLTGSLYVQGTRAEATAQGNLLIDEAQYTLQGERASEIPTLPVTLVHIPTATSQALITTKSFPVHLDLDLTAEERVMVLGKGLKSEWRGALHLTGTNMNVRADGTLDLVKGEYDLFGKTFKLTEGQILFSDKPGVRARVHLTGALSLPETTITAHLRGPLASPILTLQSNPQMSTSAILARILFNKDISDISQPEALQLATALISLSGGAGPSVLETIRKNLGVDRLAIASQTSNPDEIAVQIGKYLTKGVMITLSQSATSSQIIIEVEFKHGFVFRAETQEIEEGKFSLKWTHSY